MFRSSGVEFCLLFHIHHPVRMVQEFVKGRGHVGMIRDIADREKKFSRCDSRVPHVHEHKNHALDRERVSDLPSERKPA